MRRLPWYGFVVLLVIGLVACSQGKHKSRVYQGTDGKSYTRTHDAGSDTFIWWMLQDSGSSSQSWTRVATPTTTMAPTGKAVTVDEEEPTEEFEESVSDEDTTTESTSEAEADASDASDSGGSDSSDGGSDSGGDSGGDGGGSGC